MSFFERSNRVKYEHEIRLWKLCKQLLALPNIRNGAVLDVTGVGKLWATPGCMTYVTTRCPRQAVLKRRYLTAWGLPRDLEDTVLTFLEPNDLFDKYTCIYLLFYDGTNYPTTIDHRIALFNYGQNVVKFMIDGVPRSVQRFSKPIRCTWDPYKLEL